jgi:hypothetical protein
MAESTTTLVSVLATGIVCFRRVEDEQQNNKKQKEMSNNFML